MCRISRTFQKSYPFGGHAATNHSKSTLKTGCLPGFLAGQIPTFQTHPECPESSQMHWEIFFDARPLPQHAGYHHHLRQIANQAILGTKIRNPVNVKFGNSNRTHLPDRLRVSNHNSAVSLWAQIITERWVCSWKHAVLAQNLRNPWIIFCCKVTYIVISTSKSIKFQNRVRLVGKHSVSTREHPTGGINYYHSLNLFLFLETNWREF